MAVTPNYGWPIPVATDYVKDGWDAIADLGNAIDSTVAGIGSGLNLITTTNVSSQTSINFNNVFSSTYKIYKIIYYLDAASANNGAYFRLRTGGTNNTSSSYEYSNYRWASTGTNNYSNNGGGDSAPLPAVESAYPTQCEFNIAYPFETNKTRWSGVAMGSYSGVSGTTTQIIGGMFNATTSFDGISINSGSAAFSGIISIYGYKL